MPAARMEPVASSVDPSKIPEPIPRDPKWLARLAWAILVGVLLFQAYAYYFKLPLSLGPRVILQPWLLRHGFVLYETAVDIHTPFMPLSIAALSSLIPDGLRLAKLILVGLLSLTTLLTFVAAKRHAGWAGGIWAVFFFAVWSPTFEFGKLWHEAFLTPIYLLFFLIYTPSAAPRPLKTCALIGLLGGMAVLVKQHAAVVVLAFIAWHAFTGRRLKRPNRAMLREVVVMGAASAVPVLAYGVYQAVTAGTVRGFLYWTVGYELTGSYASLASQAPTLSEVWTLVSCALFLPAVLICLWDRKKAGDERWLVLAWGLILMVASSLTAYPRFNFFHLQGMLPVLAVLSSIALAHFMRAQNEGRSFTVAIPLAVSVLWVLTAGAAFHPVLEGNRPQKIAQYSDLLPVAQEIRQSIGPSDCIYIFPDDETLSNLYSVMGCLPPRFWVFHYPWLMVDRVKHRILSVLDENPPPWVLYLPDRWGIQASAPEIVSYIQSHYREATEIQLAEDRALLLQRK
jgi:general stress protein CsbA